MKKVLILLFVCLIFNSAFAQKSITETKQHKYFQLNERITNDDFHQDRIIFKLKEKFRSLGLENMVAHNNFNQLTENWQVREVSKVFPFHEKPTQKLNEWGNELVDLSLIYEIKFDAVLDIETAVNQIYALGIVEYAEPRYIQHTFYTPNDPQQSSQYHLNVIDAFDAWDIAQGDTNTVIGIVDSGFDFGHPDLNGQMKYNYDDPIDGEDNDNDGYVDNYRGWDFDNNDNNPTFDGNDHGVHVSGCAAPSTDNGIGVAGIGFKCKLLPVKTIDYDGIAYAADQGCSVINCSWGGPGGGSFGEDVVNYALFNKDAVVVAAAGNDNVEDLFYPASYDNVFSVAATGPSDARSSYTNYGFYVDISAPGDGVYATLGNSTYGGNTGTSMASPIVAGALALLRSHMPELNAQQAMAQIKATTDDHYNVANNNAYAGKLGSGRLNAKTALEGITSSAIVMSDRKVDDKNDSNFVIGDTLRISGDFINLLAPTTSAATLNLTASSPNVEIINNLSFLGTLETMQTTSNHQLPFEVLILPSASLNEYVVFTVELTAGTYSTSFSFTEVINVDYINIRVNDVLTSITSKSLVGFNDFSTQVEGLGFRYVPGDFENLLFDGGLMVGVPNNVMDHVRQGGGNGVDTDFVSAENVEEVEPSVVSDIDLRGKFTDSQAGASRIGLDVEHKAYAWSKPGHTKYVIVEYDITNTSGEELNDVYAGIFCDWDILDFATNKADTDESRNLGYCWSTQDKGFYAGVQVVSETPFLHYGINNDGSNGSVDIYTSYNSAQKYTTLSTNRPEAGENGGGTDVSQVVSTGPFDINDGETITVAFAMLGGDNFEDLAASADSAAVQYLREPEIVEPEDTTGTSISDLNILIKNVQIAPNPTNSISYISFSLKNNQNVKIEVVDLDGKLILENNYPNLLKGTHQFPLNAQNLKSGSYLVKISADDEVMVKKWVVMD